MSIACTVQSLEAGESTAGTAPRASRYLIIEQPGPWGREALLDSHFPRDLGRQVLERAAQARVKVLAARHPDRLERADLPERHVWLADCRPQRRHIQHATITDPSALLDWDFGATRVDPTASAHEHGQPMTFVCTHGSRDACCAVLGRSTYEQVLGELPAHERSSVWEVSHLGGHRFAPTALALPAGLVYGRLNARQLLEMREQAAAGHVSLPGLRGLSRLREPEQAADIAVRESAGIHDLDALTTATEDDAHPTEPQVGAPAGDRARISVTHTDGRQWQVQVQRTRRPTWRAESCGKDQVPVVQWQALSIEPVATGI
ncbi:MAG: sucrase ferredoxin [Candidatus Nanopelagicales bacterium]|nr:sucrase ferredoxin [Candidatus Nanopelagicales bacterium]